METLRRKDKGDEKLKIENYFGKNGVVYGISSKFEFGNWNCYIKKFNNFEEAEEWLNTEEYDFRERELCSLSKIKRYLCFMNCTNKDVLL